MKFLYLILALTLSGCVNLEFPGLIADTAKVGKDAYGAIVGKKEAQEPAKQEPAKQEPVKQEPVKQEPVKQEPVKQEPVKQEPAKQEPAKQEPVKQEPVKQAVEQTEYITHSYIGQESQSITEIKQLCVNEAADKLFKIAGREVRYTVIENTIAMVNNTVVANCRLDIDKRSIETPVARQ